MSTEFNLIRNPEPFDGSVLFRDPAPSPSFSAFEPSPERIRQAISCIDLTTLSGDDNDDRVRELCDKAKAYRVAAVCVYPAFALIARRKLMGSGIHTATVSAGFPHGLSTLESRIAEVKACHALGVDEIDIVIRRDNAIRNDWVALYEEVSAFRRAAGNKHLKVILGTGELVDPVCIYRASLTAMMAGADFIKTSTGKEAVNATLEATGMMMVAIKDHFERTGHLVGIKPAGGIQTTPQALDYMGQAAAVMGEAYVRSESFRLGASGLLDDLLAKLE